MSAPDEFRRALLQGLYDAALRGSGTDLEVFIPRGNDADVSFHLHYPIVAASSAYFAANPEPKSGRVIGDVDPEAFAACVLFMYTGELPSTEPEASPNVASILDAANFLQIDALKERCMECLGSHYLDNLEERADHPMGELAVEPAGHIDYRGDDIDALRNSLAHMAAQLKADLLVDEDGDGRAALTTFCDNLMSLNLGVDEMSPGGGGGVANEIVGTSASANNPLEDARPTRHLKDEFAVSDDDTVATSTSAKQNNAAIDSSSDPQKRCDGGNEHEQPGSINGLGRVVTPPLCVEEVTQHDDWNNEEKKEEEGPPVNRSRVFVAPSMREEPEAILWRAFGGKEAVPGASLPENVANRAAMGAGGFGATVGVEPENANYSSAPALCTEQAPADTAKANDVGAKDTQTNEMVDDTKTKAETTPKDTEEESKSMVSSAKGESIATGGATASRPSIAESMRQKQQQQVDAKVDDAANGKENDTDSTDRRPSTAEEEMPKVQSKKEHIQQQDTVTKDDAADARASTTAPEGCGLDGPAPDVDDDADALSFHTAAEPEGMSASNSTAEGDFIQAQIDELEAAKVGRPKHIRQQLNKKLKKLREQQGKAGTAPASESQPSIAMATAASSVDPAPATLSRAADKREANAPSSKSSQTKKQTKEASSKKHEALDANANTVESKANEPPTTSDDARDQSRPSGSSTTAPEVAADAAPKEESEKERMNRLLREEREKAAAAKAKKKSKRSKKHDKWLQEQEAEKSKRKDDWQGKIDKEREGVYLISQLIASELLLQNEENEKVLVLSRSLVLADPQAAVVIDAKSEDAHTVLYGGLSCRVKVAGLDRMGLNGRQGTLRYWDASNGVFSVGVDTKKGPNSDVHAFKPENLEAMPLQCNGGNKLAEEYDVEIVNLRLDNGESVGCQFTVDKSMVTSLRFARSIDEGLESLRMSRDYEEREQRIQHEERKKQWANEGMQRKAHRKRKFEGPNLKEFEEAQSAKAEEIEAKKEEVRREMERMRMHANFLGNLDRALKDVNVREYIDEFIEFYEEKFDYEFDAEDEAFFDEILDRFAYDEREYTQRLAEEMREKDGEMAELLGVELDADERALRVAYMELAREYHPDKWRADSEHGMAQDEAQNHFQKIQSAYDHLVSRFGDEEESDNDDSDSGSDGSEDSEDENCIDFIANLQGECWRAAEINHSDRNNETVKDRKQKRVHFIANLQGECWRAEEISDSGNSHDETVSQREQTKARVDFVATLQGDCWRADEVPEDS